MPNKKIIALEKELEELRLKPPGSELVIALNGIAHACIHSDPNKSKAYALEACKLAGELEIQNEQARSYLLLGSFHLEAGNLDEAMSQCRHAMEIYKSTEDEQGVASVYSRLANIFFVQGMIDKALEFYHRALKKMQETDVGGERLASYYFNIGVCYSTLDKLELAISFYEHAESYWEESGELSFLASLYNNVGSIFGKKKELVSSREYFLKALNLSEELGNRKQTASTLGNLGNLQEDLGDNRSALDFFVRSLELFEEIGNRRGTAYTCGCIGGVYTKLGRLDEAENIIMRGLEITRKLAIKDWEILCLEKITDLYEAKEDLSKALQYSQELKTCLEEYLNEKSMEKIAVLQVQFETEQKEKEAEIYRLKNVELSSMNDELRDALAHVKRLQGMLPICASCKKVRDDDGYWQQIESYISEHSDVKITHGICPECMIKLYGEDLFPE
jgi:tetratricopeptide (TPR) repeat protein